MDYESLAKKFGGTTATPVSSGVDYNSLAKKFGGTPANTNLETGGYNIPAQRPNLSTIESQNKQSDIETKKANSTTGIIGETAKGTFESLPITGPAIQYGKTVGEALATASVAKDLTETNRIKNEILVNIDKQIRKNTLLKKDTTRLKQAYNSLAGEKDQTVQEITPNAQVSNKQAMANVGNIALDILTAGTYSPEARAAESGALFTESKLPTAIKTAREALNKPVGLFTKTGGKRVLAGAIPGYGYDIVQNVQSGKTGEDIYKPGLGTLMGIAFPVATEGSQSFKNVFSKDGKYQRIVNNRKQALDVLDSYGSIKKVTEKNRARGIDVKNIVANTDLLHGAVDENGTIKTKGEGGAVDQLQQFIKPQESVVSDAIAKEGVSLPVDVVEKKLMENVDSSGLEGAALTRARNEVASDIEGYKLRSNPDGTIPLKTIQNAKVDKYSNINFMTEPEKQKAGKAIARGLKELVQENTKSVDAQNVNKELSRHYAVLDYLEKLDGKKVEGGRLGKYFAKTIGGIVGSHFGPLGTIAGSEIAGKIKGVDMAGTFNGKTGKVLTQSEAMAKAIAENAKPKVGGLPALTSDVSKTVSGGVEKPVMYQTPSGIGSFSLQEATDATTGAGIGQKGIVSRYTGGNATPDIIASPAVKEAPKVGGSITRYTESPAKPAELPTIQMGKLPKAKTDNIPVIQASKIKPPNVQGGNASTKMIATVGAVTVGGLALGKTKSTSKYTMPESKSKEKSAEKLGVPSRYTASVAMAADHTGFSVDQIVNHLKSENGGKWDPELKGKADPTDVGIAQLNPIAIKDITKNENGHDYFKENWGHEYDPKNGNDQILASAVYLNYLKNIALPAEGIKNPSFKDVITSYNTGARGYVESQKPKPDKARADRVKRYQSLESLRGNW